jgi:hypothetical protein
MEEEELTQEEKDSIILMQWLKTHCMGCEEKLTKAIHTKNSGYCDECRTEQQKWEYEHNL